MWMIRFHRILLLYFSRKNVFFIPFKTSSELLRTSSETEMTTSGDVKSENYFLHFPLQSAVRNRVIGFWCSVSTTSPPLSRPDEHKSTKSPNYRAFSLTWSAAVPIYCHRRKFYIWIEFNSHRTSLDHTTWPPFHCFGTPIRRTWHHVKTLYSMVSA